MFSVNQESVEQMLNDAAPSPVNGDAPAEIDRLLQVMASEVIAAQPAGPRLAKVVALKRRRRGLLLAPAAVGVAIALTAAAAVTIWHSTSAPEFTELVARYAGQVSLPPGADRAAYVEELRRQGAEHPGSVEEEGIRSSVGYYASCAWLTAWEVRHDTGDIAGEAQALRSYRNAVSSPWITETDAGGVVANLEDVAAAAGRGDRATVAQELDRNCSGIPSDGIR